MKKTTAKKQWTRPVLSVMLRSSSEEAVLVVCKDQTIHGKGGPSHSACTNPGNSDMAWCNAANTS